MDLLKKSRQTFSVLNVFMSNVIAKSFNAICNQFKGVNFPKWQEIPKKIGIINVNTEDILVYFIHE